MEEYLPFHECFSKLSEIERMIRDRDRRGSEREEEREVVDDEVHLIHLKELKRLWGLLGGVLEDQIGEVEKSILFEKRLEGEL